MSLAEQWKNKPNNMTVGPMSSRGRVTRSVGVFGHMERGKRGEQDGGCAYGAKGE